MVPTRPVRLCLTRNADAGRSCRLDQKRVWFAARHVLEHLERIASVSLSGARVFLPAGIDGSQKKIVSVPAHEATEGNGSVEFTKRHYSERARQLQNVPESERSALRLFNNWIKGVLIRETVDAMMAKQAPSPGGAQLAVLDLCCGRGGDLLKWKNYNPRLLLMMDNCLEALAAAAARYCVTSGLSTKIVAKQPGSPGIRARFELVDCFDDNQALPLILSAVQSASLHGFDIVSCQFSMHYAFRESSSVRSFFAYCVGQSCCGRHVHWHDGGRRCVATTTCRKGRQVRQLAVLR